MSDIDAWIKSIDKIIGAKISSLRIIRGLTKRNFAKIIGVTSQQLYKYEQGINKLSAGRMMIIAHALGVKIDYFYEELELEPIDTQHKYVPVKLPKNSMKIYNLKQPFISHLVKTSLRRAVY